MPKKKEKKKLGKENTDNLLQKMGRVTHARNANVLSHNTLKQNGEKKKGDRKRERERGSSKTPFYFLFDTKRFLFMRWFEKDGRFYVLFCLFFFFAYFISNPAKGRLVY